MYWFPCSGPCRRATVLLLIAACGSGCHVWRAVPGVSASITEGRRTSPLRITRKDGSQVIVQQPAIRDDTLFGRTRRNQSSADEMRIPLSDIREVATRRSSVWRTVVLTAGVTTGVFVAMMAVLIDGACSQGRDC